MTVAWFQGTVNPSAGTMSLALRASDGTLLPETTLPYGTSSGDVYFHTCSVNWASGSNQLSGGVTAINLTTSTVTSMNAVIDSISETGVTLGSGSGAGGTSGVIASYASVAPSAQNCTSPTTWVFDCPGSSSFTFSGHATGTVPPSGLVAWYKLQGNFNDALGVGSAGTTTGVTYGTDRFGNAGYAPSFSGSSSSYAQFVDTSLPYGSAARTMSFWFNSPTASSGTWEPTFNYGYLTSENRFGILVGQSQDEYFVGQGADVNGNLTWALNTWHNLVVTYAGGNGLVQMYVDGVATASGTESLNTTACSASNPMVIAEAVTNPTNDGHYDGLLSDFRMYNSALGATQIVGQALGGEWLFDEGSGTTTQDTGMSIGGESDGTLASTSDPVWTTGCHSNDCLTFTNSSVTTSYNAPLKFGTGAFSVSAWIKTSMTFGSSTQEAIVMGPNRCGISESWLLELRGGYPTFSTFGTGAYSGGYMEGPTMVNDGNWHLLTGTRNGTAIALYVDGTSVVTGTVSSTWSSDSGGTQLSIGELLGGSCGAGSPFVGSIDSARVYALALPAAMISTSIE